MKGGRDTLDVFVTDLVGLVRVRYSGSVSEYDIEPEQAEKFGRDLLRAAQSAREKARRAEAEFEGSDEAV